MSTQDLVLADHTAVAERHQRLTMNEEQVQLLKDTIAKGATDAELRLFIEVCRAKRLDPFSRQIYAIKRWDSKEKKDIMVYQTAIDGFRTIAERTGEYRGQGETEWCDQDGNWFKVWLRDHPPAAAKATVYRAGREPMIRIALYREYCQRTREKEPTSMWANMPANQLAKCAEAAAFRAAFPEDLSGIYVKEEMDQADNDAPAPLPAHNGSLPAGLTRRSPAPQQQQQHTPKELLAMFQLMTQKKYDEVFGGLRADLIELLGDATGTAVYNAALARQGVQDWRQFKTLKPAQNCVRDLYELKVKAQSASAEPVQDAEILEGELFEHEAEQSNEYPG
jgi:phage recombination protein Bet